MQGTCWKHSRKPSKASRQMYSIHLAVPALWCWRVAFGQAIFLKLTNLREFLGIVQTKLQQHGVPKESTNGARFRPTNKAPIWTMQDKMGLLVFCRVLAFPGLQVICLWTWRWTSHQLVLGWHSAGLWGTAFGTWQNLVEKIHCFECREIATCMEHIRYDATTKTQIPNIGSVDEQCSKNNK